MAARGKSLEINHAAVIIDDPDLACRIYTSWLARPIRPIVKKILARHAEMQIRMQGRANWTGLVRK